MPPWYIRLWCRLFDHVDVEARHGAPVTEFVFCRRCGKIRWRL